MKIARRPMPAPWIPFITLADIAWQIIIFFLLGATFVSYWSLTVTLPSASISPRETLGKTIRVDATESELRVNGMNVPMVEDLELQLSGLLAGARSEQQRGVVVSMSDDVSFQRNADILYAIQQAGGVVLISEERPHEDRPVKN